VRVKFFGKHSASTLSMDNVEKKKGARLLAGKNLSLLFSILSLYKRTQLGLLLGWRVRYGEELF